MGRIAVLAALIATVAAAGCGGGGGHAPAKTTTTPSPAASADPPARPADVAIVRGWADALRAGHVARADGLFSLPTIIENGTPPLSFRTRAEIHLFDTSLPCGARLLRTVAHHGYVLAEFKLTQRAGPGGGHCDGTGARAATAFRIVAGRIREWRRIIGLPGPGGQAPTPPPPPATGPET
jgi:hypothetical protein